MKPPYSTLTAYDLNTGTIKWQVPAGGDDPRAIAQGAKDTGYISQRTGIVTTSAGLLFQAGGDGKLRVYDSENGRVLWTGEMPAGSRGIPAMYEVNGRQFFVVNATSTIVGQDGTPAAEPADAADCQSVRRVCAARERISEVMRAKSPRRERRVLRDEIRDQLIEQILNGKLAPGERIVEMRIAQQFGVSQAPVREALRDLDLLGFVVSSPFRGAIVRQISVEELVQLYPIRAVLEGLAARHAASRIDPATLKKLEGLLATMRTAAARGDHRRAVEADFAFHLTIVEASGNRLLQQIWDRMRLATTTFLTVSKSHHSLREIVERHAAVVDALRTKDPDAAERACDSTSRSRVNGCVRRWKRKPRKRRESQVARAESVGAGWPKIAGRGLS